MAHDYEIPSPITDVSTRYIHEQMDLAATRLGTDAGLRTLQKYYTHAYLSMPSSLRETVRLLVTTAYPNRENNTRMHPEASAIEQGLIIGTRFAKLALNENSYKRYCKRLEADLKIMNALSGKGAYDLDQTLAYTGARAIAGVEHNILPNLLQYNTRNSHIAGVHNVLYRNALGYSVAQTETMLCELAMRESQPPDPDARQAMRLDIGFLGGLAVGNIVPYVGLNES